MNRLAATTGKILSLRFRGSDLQFDGRFLMFGLACTWIVGMGRYWDHPDPHLLQRLGVGSVIYVFALAALLWLVLAPLRLANLSYVHLLTLISLTSPPALLYAIPVERFFPLSTAQAINVWFLAIVAIWRVSIYFRYLRVNLQSPVAIVVIAGLLPLCGIVVALTSLNLEHAVFEIMAGLEPAPGTSSDGAYLILILLSIISMFLAPILFLFYLGQIAERWPKRDDNPPSTTSP